MSSRKRWLLGIALAVVACGVVVDRILAPDGRMEVKLIFVGYTNTPAIASLPALASNLATFERPEALLCATNTGSVPVKLWAAIPPANLSTAPEFGKPTGRGLPALLRPGESIMVPVWYQMKGRWWQFEVTYQRNSLADRLYLKAWNTGNRTVQKWAQFVLQPPKRGWALSGWITTRRDPILKGSDLVDTSAAPSAYGATSR